MPRKRTRITKADAFKFAGLIAFFVVMGIIVYVAWPYIHMLFEEDGLQKTISHMESSGIQGVLLIEALQFLQVVVAFIPGEVVQFTAGAIYGPWIGALVILVGCVLSSAFIFFIVNKLGAPFVNDMVPKKYLDKFEEFETSNKFDVMVFVLFLIPGLPKDVFTYVTPLSKMSFRSFMLITNVARIPGILLSTYAASGLVQGDIWQSIVLFAVLAIISGVALLVFNKLMQKRGSRREGHGAGAKGEEGEGTAVASGLEDPDRKRVDTQSTKGESQASRSAEGGSQDRDRPRMG